MRLHWLLTFRVVPAVAQLPLRQQIRNIAADAHGKVSVACSLLGTPLNCNVDPNAHAPMQSVFKLPFALAILHQVEQGKFALDQSIRFTPTAPILPRPYSPFQDKYPRAGVDVPLQELLEMTVSLSDNTASEILLRIAGGPLAVDDYTASVGGTGFQLRDGERAIHHDHSLQYRNWFEPQGAVRLLRAISDGRTLTADHTATLLSWMHSPRITTRLAGDLPEGISVAHKAGTSDVDEGVAAATNDMGTDYITGGPTTCDRCLRD